MSFRMIHENYNVSDLDRSIKFYGDALDLHEVRRKTTDDFIIVYLSNDASDFELELTWLKEHPQPYDLGESDCKRRQLPCFCQGSASCLCNNQKHSSSS